MAPLKIYFLRMFLVLVFHDAFWLYLEEFLTVLCGFLMAFFFFFSFSWCFSLFFKERWV